VPTHRINIPGASGCSALAGVLRLLIVSTLVVPGGCATTTPRDRTTKPMIAASSEETAAIHTDADWFEMDRFVQDARYVHRGDGPWEGRISKPPARIQDILRRFREALRTDHLPLLLEYGLKHHWMNLEFTGVGRELDVEHNEMLAELVRLLEIPKYMTAHEAGWLNSQFYGEFSSSGWSSYQVYVETNERGSGWWSELPNAQRIGSLMSQIRHSGKSDVGGYGVCHYGCK
jgi:hypothetical protein